MKLSRKAAAAVLAAALTLSLCVISALPGEQPRMDAMTYNIDTLPARDLRPVVDGPETEADYTPPAQAIRTWINGELRQDAVTDELIFSIAHVIAELSQGMTLQAGTVIATGTPAGVGMGFDPPKFLKAGDVVRCEIEGIGVLENTVE